MADPDWLIFGATLSPLAVVLTSRVSIRVWQHILRRRFELEARTALVRDLSFRAIGRRSLATHVRGRAATVAFGPTSDEVGWRSRRKAPAIREPQSARGSQHRQAVLATIDIECRAELPVHELLVEIFPPTPLKGPPSPIKGPEDLTYALLEMPMADHLLEGERVQWSAGRLQIITHETRSARAFVSLVQKAAEVAEYLELRGAADVEKRLVDEALFLRCTESRLRAIRLLVDLQDSPLVRSALFRLAADDDPVVRLNAGRALGPDGRPALRALAQNGQVPEAIRIAAIETLVEAPDAGPLLERLLRDPRSEIACLALRALVRIAAHSVVIEAISDPETDEGLILTGIEALEGVGFEQIADAVHRLSIHRSHRVQTAAVDLIGRRGGSSSLPELKRLQRDQMGGPLSLTMAIETAIALIRVRHRNDAGRLSLNPTGVPLGALSRPPPSGLAVCSEGRGDAESKPRS